MLGCGKLEDLVLENMKVNKHTDNITVYSVRRCKHDSVAQR